MSNNILYVEPNYTEAWGDGVKIFDNEGNPVNKVYELPPTIEDYCIAIDLEVEVCQRSEGSYGSSDSRKILFSWNSKKEPIHFNEGEKFSFNGSDGITKSINYLTSSPSEYGTLEDVMDYNTKECFGINSIDISYNNYAVPEVVIKFTDIRGMSLFAPEELRRDDNGEINKDIAGSFFKCFFQFPYPVFRLMVKGFYGHPVSYELCCCDFRADFDCKTGNFGATAKFVGYAFSLLNDVTMNALVAAPYSTYIGKEYWAEMVHKEFIVDNKPMPTLVEIVKKLKSIKTDIDRESKESPLSLESKKLDNEELSIKAVYDTFDAYYNSLIKILLDLNIENDKSNPYYDSNTYSFLLFNTSETINEKINFEDLNESYSKFETAVKNHNGNYGSHIISPPKFDRFALLPLTDKTTQERISRSTLSNYKEFVGAKYTHVQIYDASEFAKLINDIKQNNKNNINSIQSDIARKKNEIISQHLGFKPTIKNITSILMAHFDTLVHCIYNCANAVKQRERKASELGLTMTDVKIYDDVAPPFPKVVIQKTENGVLKNEESWMGDLPRAVNEPEVNLIEGLLDATNEIAKAFEEASAELMETNSYESLHLEMEIPLTALDIVLNTKPFGSTIEFSNLSEFIGKVGLRMMSLFGLSEAYDDACAMGKADAINFAKEYKKPSKKFLSQLKNGIITPSLMMDCMLNKNSTTVNEYKTNGGWAWDCYNDISSVNLLKNVNGSYELNLYKTENSYQSLPVNNIEWDNINNENLNGSIPSTDNYVFNKCISVDKENDDKVLRIDTDYRRYSKFANSMKVDDKQFSYVEDLGLEFNAEDYCDDFFDNDSEVFAKTFASSQLKDNDNIYSVSYECGENSWLLPPYFPTLEEAKKSTSFKSGKGYEDFDYLLNYKDGKSNRLLRNKMSFCDAFGEVDYVDSFTTLHVCGILNGSQTNDYSLFGQYEYYVQTMSETKALLFLDCLKYYDGIGFNNYGGFDFGKATDILVNDEKHFSILPYCAILLIGAYLWRYQYKENNMLDPIIYGNNLKFRDINQQITNDGELNTKIFDLRKDVKQKLIKEFTDWVKSENGFKYIQTNFEITVTSKKSQVDFIIEFGDLMNQASNKFENFIKQDKVKYSGITTIEEYLIKNVDHKFFENYISFRCKYGNLKLYNRETSVPVKSLTRLYLKPCMIVKPTKYIMDKDYGYIKMHHKNCYSYLNSFINELIKQYENVETEPKEVNVNAVETDVNIKICLYKYIKILWDKWFSGNKEDFWSFGKFYGDNWYFIDSFYNKIGDDLLMNVLKFGSDLMYSQHEHTYSLFSFISKAYAVNNVSLQTVQNFMDLCNNETASDNINDLFKPIPYNRIDYPNLKKHPSFILLYTYEFSSKLDIDNNDYLGDSFNINGDQSQLPTPITSKTQYNGYKIPAFGVVFGKQYQSYFKDINVSMDSPIVTEHALRAQFEIASAYSKKGENGKNATVLGQDLYTVYSNNSYTCTVTMMGCAWIQPLMYFQLTNVPMFRGAYMVQKVTHSIRPGVMETKFVGTRMSRHSQRYVDKWCHFKPNDETSPIDSSDRLLQQAKLDNDCEYKFFNPLINFEQPMSQDDLNMTLSAYENKVGNKFDKVVNISKDTKVINFLAGVLKKEAGTQDDLGIKMTATVLFNRYMFYGGDLTKMFKGKQHEIGTTTEEEYTKIVEEIFTNYPIILKGEKTYVGESIPIFNSGVTIGQSVSKTLTEHDVKSMDGYCTTDGYNIKHERTSKTEPLNGWWRTKGEYIAQHDNPNGQKGHVYVGGFMKYGKEHWQIKENNNQQSVDSNPSVNAQGLFNSIKKTIEFSSVININDVKLETTKTNDYNMFYITCNPISGLSQVFDIIVNTYYDYISSVYWLVKSDAKETPYKLQVTFDNESPSKIIAIGKLNNNESVSVHNQHDNLNTDFNKTIKKKYMKDGIFNSKDFKIECKNFNSYITSHGDTWEDDIKNIVGVESIAPCGDVANFATVEGYTWNGNGHIANDFKPNGKFTSYNSSSVADYAKNNSGVKSKGACAKAVRIAMMESGGGNVSEVMATRPNSACVYAKFMEAWGFTEVYSGFGKKIEGSYRPQKGDISIIAGKVDGNEKHLHGHIQIFNDDKWYSDYGCNTAWCYGDEGRPFKIYRWIS